MDERGEIFPYCNGKPCFQFGDHTDVLTACGKEAGIGIVLRSMGPEWIAVDEITAEQDAMHLLHASNCGVKLLASAHASSLEEYKNRTVYQPLIQHSVFKVVVVLRKDRTYCMERVTL